MNKPRKIVGAKNDSKGNISHVKLEGNSSYTSLETAIGMAENGQVDAVVVSPSTAKKHLRQKPDGKQKNNLDYLADS